MKFSGKIEDGTSNEPLNFGDDLWPWRRSALSECFSSCRCALLNACSGKEFNTYLHNGLSTSFL